MTISIRYLLLVSDLLGIWANVSLSVYSVTNDRLSEKAACVNSLKLLLMMGRKLVTDHNSMPRTLWTALSFRSFCVNGACQLCNVKLFTVFCLEIQFEYTKKNTQMWDTVCGIQFHYRWNTIFRTADNSLCC